MSELISNPPVDVSVSKNRSASAGSSTRASGHGMPNSTNTNSPRSRGSHQCPNSWGQMVSMKLHQVCQAMSKTGATL
jgi:hypothetical protein